ncbi:MAG TPA: carbohydrate kinase family protein [Patescibacteria group bacterium]|nr:carbohydrate kinase family protein [Patescibacteria group bacterium]
MKYQIITIGGCLKDIFIKAPSEILFKGKWMGRRRKYIAYPYGDKVSIDELTYDFGGCSFNAAINFSGLGIKTAFATVLGDDSLSSEAWERIKQKKVRTDFIKKEKNSYLGFSVVLIGEDGDRSILTYRAKNDFSKIDLDKILRSTDSIYLSGVNQSSGVLQDKLFNKINSKKKKLYLNPSGFQLKQNKTKLKKLISKSEVVAMNLNEASELLEVKNAKIKNVLGDIYDLGAKSIIITNGKEGAYFYDGKRFLKIGLYPAKRISSTGSGDCFFSTFIAAGFKGYSIDESLKLASINSASVIKNYGAQKGLLNWEPLIKRLKQNKVRVTEI